jgi:hypothetical protein
MDEIDGIILLGIDGIDRIDPLAAQTKQHQVNPVNPVHHTNPVSTSALPYDTLIVARE